MELKGRWVIVASWASVGVFAFVSVLQALPVDSLDDLAAGVDLALFFISLPVWAYAFVRALARTARGDEIGVASLYFLTTSAPRSVRRQLMGALIVSIAIAVGAAVGNPYGVLVPMLPLGLAGLWGALYGTYPARSARVAPKGGSR
jgi:hypothetical protein